MVSQVYQAALKRFCDLEISQEQVKSRLQGALAERSRNTRLRTSEDGERSFWRAFVRQLADGHPQSDLCFAELFAYFGLPSHWRAFPEVSVVVNALTARGITCAIGSNFDGRLHRILDGMPDLAGISHRFVSSELGWRKPATQFFEAVCRQLDLPADQILVVGDDPLNDVTAARRAGCRAAWIHRSEALPAAGLPDEPPLKSLTDLLTDP